jgi:glycosyltransferase involved in cell wall biosynthesis
MAETKSLIIVQPYLPKYRLAFFSRLIDVLKQSDIRCQVAAAAPSEHQTDRADADGADWLIPVHHRRLRIGARTLTLGGAAKSWAGADGVIVGHLGSSVDTYRAILDSKRPRRRLRVGLWGHIDSYVADSHPLDAAAERWQLRQADHVFAYSASGAAFAATAGVPADRLTTVMNTVDTQALAEVSQSLTDSAVADYMSRHRLKPGRTLGFFGGLDESKRISFLAEALERLWATDPDLRVVVGGEGSQSSLLDVSISRGQTVRIGYATPYEQAMIGRVASALLMPGRIGLVAVDALVLGIPILTTDWPYHSAEAEYLTEGESRYTSRNDVDSYVALVKNFMLSPGNGINNSSGSSWNYPTIDNMVANFSSGVLAMLA